MTKAEIFDLIYEKRMSLFNIGDSEMKNQRLIHFLKDHSIVLPIKKINVQNVYDYLRNITNHKCLMCNKELMFLGFREIAYKTLCSNKCRTTWLGKIHTGENNTCYRMTEESKNSMKKKISLKIKNMIKEGKFLPNITNSWARSKCEIYINNKIVKTRSSWEAFYYLVNPTLEYEKLIVQYKVDNVEYNYIVDFVDHIHKQVFEIKPEKYVNKKIIDLKLKSLKKWCKNNNYQYNLINNKWFVENYNKHKHLIIGQPSQEKMLRNLKQFE